MELLPALRLHKKLVAWCAPIGHNHLERHQTATLSAPPPARELFCRPLTRATVTTEERSPQIINIFSCSPWMEATAPCCVRRPLVLLGLRLRASSPTHSVTCIASDTETHSDTHHCRSLSGSHIGHDRGPTGPKPTAQPYTCSTAMLEKGQDTHP